MHIKGASSAHNTVGAILAVAETERNGGHQGLGGWAAKWGNAGQRAWTSG